MLPCLFLCCSSIEHSDLLFQRHVSACPSRAPVGVDTYYVSETRFSCLHGRVLIDAREESVCARYVMAAWISFKMPEHKQISFWTIRVPWRGTPRPPLLTWWSLSAPWTDASSSCPSVVCVMWRFLGLQERLARDSGFSTAERVRLEHEHHIVVRDQLNIINLVGSELVGRQPQLLEAVMQDGSSAA